MKCLLVGRAILSISDGPDLEISVDGKTFHFEFDSHFGPLFVGKRGQDINQPGPKHKVWKALTWWKAQGMRSENGKAIWEEVEENPFAGFVQISKRTWVSESIAKKYGLHPTADRSK